jgi:hypothetical protein
MKILITVPDDFTPKDGDALDAVRDALEHFEIPAMLHEVQVEVAQLTQKIYDAYGTDSGVLFGLAPHYRGVIEVIVKEVLTELSIIG